MRRLQDITADTDTQLDVNMSPLIDMVFLLLIFFIVTAVFVRETGVEVNRPKAKTASAISAESIQVAITAEGRIVHAGRTLALSEVRGLVARLLRGARQRPVIVVADEHAASGILIRVIDEAKLAGADQVSIAAHRKP